MNARVSHLLATAFLLAAPMLHAYAIAKQPVCTRAEIRQSARYYDDRGFPRGATLQNPPKRCTTAKTIVPYPVCPGGKNIDLAAQFLSANGSMVRRAAVLSDMIYKADTEFKTRSPIPEVGHGEMVEMQGFGSPHRVVNLVSIPDIGKTYYYWVPKTDLVFSVANGSTSPEKDLVYLAFRGTSEGKHHLEANFPEMDPFTSAPMYGDAGFAAAKVRAAIAGQAGVIERNLSHPARLKAALQETCNTTVVFTGHSLGGGLAIRAATTSTRTQCERKSDALIVFNPASPSLIKDVFILPKGGHPSLMTAAVFQNALDPVKHLEGFLDSTALVTRGGAGLLRSLEATTQVIHFGGMRFADHHSMSKMASQILTYVPEQGGTALRPDMPFKLCDWYTPL